MAFRNNYSNNLMRPVFRSNYFIPGEMALTQRYWFSPSSSAFSIGRFFEESRHGRPVYGSPYSAVRDGAVSTSMPRASLTPRRTRGRFINNKRVISRALNRRVVEPQLRFIKLPKRLRQEEQRQFLRRIRWPMTTKRPTWLQQASLGMHLKRRAVAAKRSLGYRWYSDHFDVFYRGDYAGRSARLNMMFMRRATRAVKPPKRVFGHFRS